MVINALPAASFNPALALPSGARGSEGARAFSQGHQRGAEGTPAPSQAPTTVPEAATPRPVHAPHGLLKLQMDQVEVLQGIQSGDLPGTAPEAESDVAEKPDTPGALSEEEEAQVRDLAARDQEVRQHEQAHAAAGGGLAGAPSYQYEQGPDGQRYAVGGEVSIDTSAVRGDPKATIAKMQQVLAAANAPAKPSGQDRAVAAAAAAKMQAAQAQLNTPQVEEGARPDETKPTVPGGAANNGHGPEDPANAIPRRILPPGSFTDISV